MARKPRTNPRKSASQERSRHTVTTLLDATTRVLVKEGYDRASTNRIAAVAGVSIGSLYQYFPSKEALVAAVRERHQLEVLRLMRNALSKVAGRPIAAAAREFVSVAIEAHRVHPHLHRVLAEQVPRMGRPAEIEAINQEVYGLVQSYCEAHREEIDVTDLELAVFICFTAVDALTHAAVLQRPDLLADARAEKFVDEVTDLVIRYLRK